MSKGEAIRGNTPAVRGAGLVAARAGRVDARFAAGSRTLDPPVALAPAVGRSSRLVNSQSGFGSMSGRKILRTSGLDSAIAMAIDANTIVSSHTADEWSSLRIPDSRIGYSTNECSRYTYIVAWPNTVKIVLRRGMSA